MCSATPSSAVLTTGPSNERQRVRRRRLRRGVTTLMYAAQQGDVESVKNLVRMQPSLIYDSDRTGKTALHYCCTSDSVRAAQAADILVMAAPELVENRDEDGFTPLHLAVIAGNVQLVTFLLANNADVTALDNEKHTVVHWATVCGETAALRAVLAAGAPVSTPDLHRGYPLHYAAQMCGGDKDSNLGMEVLQALLTHRDIDVSVTDGDKRQPLLWAASAGSSKALLALIRAGAAVEAPDKDGLTALHCAASRGHTDCLDTLLTLCGASPDIIDSNGCTALHYAVTLGHADATALLLAHGTDPNRQDRKGRSPAHCGCAKGQFETVKLIGAHGANLWLRNARGDLPLHEAAASGRRELVNWLLNMRPSQVNARNNDGRCPLHMAAINDNADMCKILLDAGAFVNPILRTSKNVFMTPLDCALQKGFRSTAKFLQLHGGVPAARVGDPVAQKVETTSALSLQIRDDVTLWGDTSSGSEKEVAEIEKAHRKIKRRKLLAQRHMRKKQSVSESEAENGLNRSPKRDKSNERRKSKESFKTKEELAQKASESLRNPASSRLEYSNEIIINGKTEINIHQTKEISIEREGTSSRLELQEKITVPAPTGLNSATEKEKRPKSAKYSKLKEKSGNEPTNPTTTVETESLRTTAQRETSSRFSLRHQSTNTSEETGDTVIDNSKTLLEVGHNNQNDMPTSNKHVDGQSLRSNTSEDIEVQKDIVVEAAVHPQPKISDETMAKNLKIEQENQEKNRKIEGSPVKQHQEEVQMDQIKTEERSGTRSEADINRETADAANNQKESDKDVKTKETDKPSVDSEHKEETSEQAKQDESCHPDPEGFNIVSEKDQILNVEHASSKSKSALAIEAIEDVAGINTTKNEINTVIATTTELAKSENKDETIETKKRDDEQLAHFQGSLEEYETETEDKSDVIPSKSVSQDQDVTLVEKYASEKHMDKTDGETERKTTISNRANKAELPQTKKKKNSQKQESKPNTTANEAGPIDHERNYRKSKQGVQQQEHKDEISSHTLRKGVGIRSENLKTKEASKIKQNINVSDEEVYSSAEDDSHLESARAHKSFKVLDAEEAKKLTKPKPKRRLRKSRSPHEKDARSKSEETRTKTHDKYRASKIPTPLFKMPLSKSDRHLDKSFKLIERDVQSSLAHGVPSLPNIYNGKDTAREPPRSESNMSAPILNSVYSDNERGSASDLEEDVRSSSFRRKRLKKRQKSRGSRSAGSDYESSNLIDSGFEPSPRSTRIPRWRNMSERGVNMTSVTQTIQSNIRRYHLERKIFQHLLELKRSQIRAGKHNEAVLVKRAIDQYHQSCAATVGAGRYIPKDYSFKSFEKFLYESLRKLQKNDADYLKGLPETSENINPLLCTESTNRCMHAVHAYTGIPCAAYLPRMDHHTIPKIGFSSVACKPGTAGFLPNINQKKAVTLELSHGTDKQVISLPTDRLDQNKRYYVTFTVKGRDQTPSSEENAGNNESNAHRHSKSD